MGAPPQPREPCQTALMNGRGASRVLMAVLGLLGAVSIGGLIVTVVLGITGGIAAKNPHLIESPAFIDEFNDGRAYRQMLERVPIYLNEDQSLGLRGAAIHAWMELQVL